MPRTNGNAEFNNFVAGLITEASPLDFPENASLDEVNMFLNRDGSRQRRLGMDYESGYTLRGSSVDTNNFTNGLHRASTYRWDNVGGDPTLSLGVIQIGEYLWFIDLYADSPSAALKNSGGSVRIPSAQKTPLAFATVNGKLAVSTPDGFGGVFTLAYDRDTDVVTETEHILYVRDIWGVDDGLAVDKRPTSLTKNHRYNLKNQGWPDINVDGTGIIDYFDREIGAYPSNADIWYLGTRPGIDGEGSTFDPDLLAFGNWFGNTPAPKGHYITRLFNRASGRAPGTIAEPDGEDRTVGGVGALAAYAGRLFYSGFTSRLEFGDSDKTPRLTSMVAFSQVLTSDEKLGQCYQVADPTEKDSVGLLATDGGTITIPEASLILELIPVGKSLVVFAENGVWVIRGSEEGFSAVNFQIDKVSNVGAASKDSIVEAENRVFYWSKSGIYILEPDKVTGELGAVNITETTIQTRYAAIPPIGRRAATGHYDTEARQLKWLYNDQDSYDGLAYIDRFNKELVLDLTLNAFYFNSIPSQTTGPSAAGYISTPNYLIAGDIDNVVVGSDNIVVGSDNLITREEVRTRGVSSLKYLTLLPGALTSDPMQFTLSEYRNADFLDWYTYDSTGTDAEAYVETGHFTGGDNQRNKSVKYLTVHSKRTETGYEVDGNGNLALANEGSCLVQSKWDFTDSATSGKWSDEFQTYRLSRPYIPTGISDSFDYGYDVITTKNKLRGSGLSLRLKFKTEPGKDFYLYGWALDLSQSNNV